jgi:imidazolonepropionase-like amidohydrolase
VTIVIEGDRITRVACGGVDIPPGSRVIDAVGLTIIPGLIDLHVHSHAWSWPLFLKFGVTTVRDVASDPDEILMAREEERQGRLVAPRIIAAGPLLDGMPPVWGPSYRGSLAVGSVEEARAAANYLLDRGVDWLKLYSRLPLDAAEAIVNTAHARGIPVAAHLGLVTAHQAANLGVRTIEHASGMALIRPQSEIEADAQFFAAKDTLIVPTLLVNHNLANLPRIATPEYPHLDLVPDERRQQWMDWQHTVPFLQNNTPGTFVQLQQAAVGRSAFVKSLHDAGGKLAIGTDTPNPFVVPGASFHQELALMAAAGIPPLSALRYATSGAADALGRTDLGTVTEGSLADLVLLSGDPANQITATKNIRTVIKGGMIVHEI